MYNLYIFFFRHIVQIELMASKGNMVTKRKSMLAGKVTHSPPTVMMDMLDLLVKT